MAASSGKERKSDATKQKKERKTRKGKLSLKKLLAGKTSPESDVIPVIRN